VELPSGLQYRIVEEGSGEKPVSSDTVKVHYRGTLIDGTEFDSSYARGEPVTFQVAKIINGWQQALILMSEGAKWQVFIPPILAYGSGGAGQNIGPNATLVFEIELVSIEKN
ncbi:MAG: FKBP-type peptidyl-prolyl cis-trans isomerase, partial [Acidiferrobacterales bacterium]